MFEVVMLEWQFEQPYQPTFLTIKMPCHVENDSLTFTDCNYLHTRLLDCLPNRL